MEKRYIIALDQGTTSSRAVLINQKGKILDIRQKEFDQIFPKPGWVEHDPEVIWDSQQQVLFELIDQNNINLDEISGIGITNQRETTIIWDRATGKPVYNAIVWQDTRTSDLCESLIQKGLKDYVHTTTGLFIDSYFSATKVKWILDNVSGAKEKAWAGDLAMGTVDSWLLWKLTEGRIHSTDYSNASRTMLFNIRKLSWDKNILNELEIPEKLLPEVQPSSHHFGDFKFKDHSIPIASVIGDQQAALFGQACFEPGMAKNTYGTGCFMLMNTGEKAHSSKEGLLTTIAWGLDQKIYYALEGSIFVAGAAVQWLRDQLKIINHAAESEELANQVDDEHGIYVVPAFSGLGAPYWDMYARGSIFGITRDTGVSQITRATLESMAFQTCDVLNAMEKDAGIKLSELKVDGGAAANDFLMQFQANMLDVAVERPEVIESTALGAAYMAGLQTGFWQKEDIRSSRKIDKIFHPEMDNNLREKLYSGWKKAVGKAMHWAKENTNN